MDGRESLVGQCRVHGTNLILEDGQPRCLQCMKDEARRTAQPAPAVEAVDPGHEWAMGQMHGPAQGVSAKADPRTSGDTLVVGGSSSSPVAKAIQLLRTAPMPADMRSYKAIQRAIKALESTLQPQEA